MKNVIVVGGGAAGMMAGVAALEAGHQVTIIEKNEKLGKKVFITGKGRCNVTNACDTQDFFNSCMTNSKFLYSAIYGYDAYRVMDFFESNGCKLKIERGERVFPVSDHSSDIIRTLENVLVNKGAKILKNNCVSDILTNNGTVTGVALKNGKKISCDGVILCNGGKSYPQTGSDGNGYVLAGKLGHNITDLHPGLVPVVIKEQFCQELMGLSLKNVELSVVSKGKRIYNGFGEMLFTHFGISGPLVLTASSKISRLKDFKDTKAIIDLKPALSFEQLDKRILRDFDDNKNKQFKNVLSGMLPSKLIPVIIELSNIDPFKNVNEITKEERTGLVNLLKNFEMTITNTRDFNEAIITIGGVNVKEVNPSTMESRLVKGLYFAGEILDLDAVTGGFNLQIAWSTGYLAGSSI